jgi:Zn-dependent protease with chaperone function
MLAFAVFPSPFAIASMLLALPLILTICMSLNLLRKQDDDRRAAWTSFRLHTNFILALAIAAWWVIWNRYDHSTFASLVASTYSQWISASLAEALLFWMPPLIMLGVFLFVGNLITRHIFAQKWTIIQTIWQSGWQLISFAVPLLMVTRGFERLLEGRFGGFLWLLGAGISARVGTGFLRFAQGMRWNQLRTGEIRNRALAVARRMEVPLQRVFMVPAGKGHLTNAYGMSDAIGVTDNLGKYLTKAQLDFVLSHEVAHVKLKHARKSLLVALASYSAVALLLLFIRREAAPIRPWLEIFAIIAPLICIYYASRKFEFSADHEAAKSTGEPETAIIALLNLSAARQLPVATSRFTALFMTHPTLAQRISAIADSGSLRAEHLSDALRRAHVAIAPR